MLRTMRFEDEFDPLTGDELLFILPLVANGVPKHVVTPSIPTHICVSWGTTTLKKYASKLQDQNAAPLL